MNSSEKITVSIILASTRPDGLWRLVRSVKDTTVLPHEIIAVSPIPLPDMGITVIRETDSTGCVQAFVQGMKAASGEYLIHVNDDAEFQPFAIDNMIAAIGNRDNVLGAFAIKEPDMPDYGFNYIFDRLYANFGCAKRSLFERLGYWDLRYQMYGADPDFSLQVWNSGGQVIPVQYAKVLHHCTVDSNRKEHLRPLAWDKLKFKWKGIYC